MEEVRVDKWLWAARFFKSRTLAAAACDGGKVDVNDQAAKPSKVVRAGDLFTINPAARQAGGARRGALGPERGRRPGRPPL